MTALHLILAGSALSLPASTSAAPAPASGEASSSSVVAPANVAAVASGEKAATTPDASVEHSDDKLPAHEITAPEGTLGRDGVKTAYRAAAPASAIGSTRTTTPRADDAQDPGSAIFDDTALPLRTAPRFFSQVDHALYSNGRGERSDAMLGARLAVGPSGTAVVEARSGRRDYGDVAFSGRSLTGNYYHDFGGRVSSRTLVSLSSDDPVYANRAIGQEVTVGLFDAVTASAGVRAIAYAGGVDATAFHLGPTAYFQGGFAKLTLTRFVIDGAGGQDDGANAALVTARMHDRPGGGAWTQFWLGGGTSLVDEGIAPDVRDRDGRQLGVAVRRFQPLADGMGLTLDLHARHYTTDRDEYRRVGASIGLQFDL